MILDEKCLFPPPPYFARPPPSEPSRGITITALPPHLLLQIISCTFPETDGKYPGESKLLLQRGTLHWLHSSLRFVNRDMYIACMHVLRSTYLPAYAESVRHPYTSDPFPVNNFSDLSRKGKSSYIFPSHRELPTLDLFIALLTHEDRLQDYSSLYLTRDEAYKDIFDLLQPTSRLEDLVGELGRARGVITPIFPGVRTPVQPQTPPPPPSPTPTNEKADSESSTYAFLSSLDDDSRYTYTIPPSPSQLSLNSNTTTAVGSRASIINATSAAPSSRASRGFLSSLFKSKSRPNAGASSSASASGPSSSRLSTATSVTITPTLRPKITPLQFSTLSISFSPRIVKLMYTPPSPAPSRVTSPYSSSSALPYTTGKATSSAIRNKKTLAQVERTRDEPLENTAKRLVSRLKEYLEQQATL